MSAHDHDKIVIETVKKVSSSVVSIVISKYMPSMKGTGPMSFFNPFSFNDAEDGAKEKVKIGDRVKVVFQQTHDPAIKLPCFELA